MLNLLNHIHLWISLLMRKPWQIIIFQERHPWHQMSPSILMKMMPQVKHIQIYQIIADDEDLVAATERLDISEGDQKGGELQKEERTHCLNEVVDAEEEAVSGAETESFMSATDELDYSTDTFVTAADTEVSASSIFERQDNDGGSQSNFASNIEHSGQSSFIFAASSADHAKEETNLSHVKEHEAKQENISPTAVSIATQEACEKWRLRGNQAYAKGDFSQAEECYTQGMNLISQNETSRSCLRALMLCYSNRAATRMSLGRMREALKDCMEAAALDPNFIRVQVRAANCYLALGEVENATLHFMMCLQAGP
ncbi:Heat shock protein DnaJ with tetratricopeptide repeat [Forsythia ovata]|uniref:Heat shock protein DnaJ with tetratricopeptide repeat n=1 Tax=Forsythia ovata TaxID=205694 RepID=A0ABD1X5L0_9LAMI